MFSMKIKHMLKVQLMNIYIVEEYQQIVIGKTQKYTGVK